jgi:response regulator RpfG family c-di-GMP phosphodiesterase
MGHLAALREIDLAISSSLDVRLTLNILLERLIAQLNVDAADVLLLNPHSRCFEYKAGLGFQTTALRYTRLRFGDGYAGRAAQERRIIHLADLHEQKDAFSRSPMMREEGFRDYCAIPMVAKGRVLGVIEIFHRSALGRERDWLEFLDMLSTQAAIAVDNASLFDDLERSNIELRLAYDATIEGWSRALDFRDQETEGHSKRVTDMTVSLAYEIGFKGDDLIHVRRGALLHDIGKLGVPDSILLKPDKLTEEEWGVMKRHPDIAHELISPVKFLRPALPIPYSHHERWDGSGYPKGLRKDQIPLEARIFSVVDVWDALTSVRPYRPAWSEDQAAEYPRSNAESHFDPAVVETFFAVKG